MSYVQARFKKRRPPPNPIVVGCGGTIYLVLLYALGYGIMQVLMPRIKEVTPDFLRATLTIPEIWTVKMFGATTDIPLSNDVIMWTEITLIVILLLGLSSVVYSFYYEATREKEGWELYADEAERQAKMAKNRK